MRVENKTSDKYSTKKKIKSCSLKLEAHRLKAVVVHRDLDFAFVVFYVTKTSHVS